MDYPSRTAEEAANPEAETIRGPHWRSVFEWARVLRLDDRERRHGVPAGSMTSLMRQESFGRNDAVSTVIINGKRKRAAAGLFQIMPATALSYGVGISYISEELYTKHGDRYYIRRDLTEEQKQLFRREFAAAEEPIRQAIIADPHKAADIAVREYAMHLRSFDGDRTKAFAAYNRGPGNIRRDLRDHARHILNGQQHSWTADLPGETRGYIRNTLSDVAFDAAMAPIYENHRGESAPALHGRLLESPTITRQVEQRLKELGYNPGALDGRADANLHRAIRQFEADMQQDVVSIANGEAWRPALAGFRNDGLLDGGSLNMLMARCRPFVDLLKADQPATIPTGNRRPQERDDDDEPRAPSVPRRPPNRTEPETSHGAPRLAPPPRRRRGAPQA